MKNKDTSRKDVAGGLAKVMAGVHRNGGVHKDRKKSTRFGGKEKRLALIGRV